jgi:hypothetical protein
MEERQVGALRMKRINRRISILMGVTLSLCLSLVAHLFLADKFTFTGFLLSFAISLTISLIIGLIVPMKKVNDAVDRSLNLRPFSIKARLVESLVSDLIYTPIMTVIMTTISYFIATNNGADIPYVPMLLKSLLVCFLVGYVLIFIFQPLFMTLVIGKRRMAAAAGAAAQQAKNKAENNESK